MEIRIKDNVILKHKNNIITIEFYKDNKKSESSYFRGIKSDEVGKYLDFASIKCRVTEAELTKAMELISVYQDALKQKIKKWEEENKKENGLCPICHTYCYGDCRSN